MAALKAEGDDTLTILGSGALIRALQARNLIDEYLLLIHPLLLGTGARLFAEGVLTAPLQLIDSVVTTKGVVIATYRPTQPV